jgi:hypothetical protein
MTETAKLELAISMCYTWAHDFGLDRQQADILSSGWTETERQALISKMLQLIEHHWPQDAKIAP